MTPFMSEESIATLLVRNIPRDLVMGVEDALKAGAQRGFGAGASMSSGHRSHAVGQMRHFHMNEAFWDALSVAGTEPTPIQGNRVVKGRSGVFTLGRFNISNGVWNNGRRSRTRREMALANRSVEPLLTRDLFGPYEPATNATAFFVAAFDRSVQDSLAVPLSIDIAVPDHKMEGWLFRMPVTLFLELYETAVTTQPDMAVPKLKAGVVVAKSLEHGS